MFSFLHGRSGQTLNTPLFYLVEVTVEVESVDCDSQCEDTHGCITVLRRARIVTSTAVAGAATTAPRRR